MRIALFQSALIRRLEAELDEWKQMYRHERQAKERAIDTLLQMRLGTPPMHVLTPEERVVADQRDPFEILKGSEFEAVGGEVGPA